MIDPLRYRARSEQLEYVCLDDNAGTPACWRCTQDGRAPIAATYLCQECGREKPPRPFCKTCAFEYHERRATKRGHRLLGIVRGEPVEVQPLEDGDGVTLPELHDWVGVHLQGWALRPDGALGPLLEDTRALGRPLFFQSGCSGPCLHLQVLDCVGLASADVLGASDPYCAVYWQDALVGVTSTKFVTLNPRWSSQTFVLPVGENFVRALDDSSGKPEAEKALSVSSDHLGEPPLRIDVFDWDLLGANDFLGQCRLTERQLVILARGTEIDSDAKVRVPLRDRRGRGRLGVRLAQGGSGGEKLLLQVVCARSLPKLDPFHSRRPFCRVYWNNVCVFATEVAGRTADPDWQAFSATIDIDTRISNGTAALASPNGANNDTEAAALPAAAADATQSLSGRIGGSSRKETPAPSFVDGTLRVECVDAGRSLFKGGKASVGNSSSDSCDIVGCVELSGSQLRDALAGGLPPAMQRGLESAKKELGIPFPDETDVKRLLDFAEAFHSRKRRALQVEVPLDVYEAAAAAVTTDKRQRSSAFVVEPQAEPPAVANDAVHGTAAGVTESAAAAGNSNAGLQRAKSSGGGSSNGEVTYLEARAKRFDEGRGVFVEYVRSGASQWLPLSVIPRLRIVQKSDQTPEEDNDDVESFNDVASIVSAGSLAVTGFFGGVLRQVRAVLARARSGLPRAQLGLNSITSLGVSATSAAGGLGLLSEISGKRVQFFALAPPPAAGPPAAEAAASGNPSNAKNRPKEPSRGSIGLRVLFHTRGTVIRGLDVAVSHMTLGQRALVEIRQDYAHGDAAVGPAAPPHSRFAFDVQVVSVRNRSAAWMLLKRRWRARSDAVWQALDYSLSAARRLLQRRRDSGMYAEQPHGLLKEWNDEGENEPGGGVNEKGGFSARNAANRSVKTGRVSLKSTSAAVWSPRGLAAALTLNTAAAAERAKAAAADLLPRPPDSPVPDSPIVGSDTEKAALTRSPKPNFDAAAGVDVLNSDSGGSSESESEQSSKEAAGQAKEGDNAAALVRSDNIDSGSDDDSSVEGGKAAGAGAASALLQPDVGPGRAS